MFYLKQKTGKLLKGTVFMIYILSIVDVCKNKDLYRIRYKYHARYHIKISIYVILNSILNTTFSTSLKIIAELNQELGLKLI